MPGPQNQDEQPITARFRIMGMDSIIRGLGYVDQGEVAPFMASHSRPTEWMEYRGELPLNFYRLVDLEGLTEDSPPPPVIASFTPNRDGDVLLLFVRNSNADTLPLYQIVPIPDPAGEIAEGVRFFNMTPHELAVSVNNETIRLRSGQRRQINPSPGHNNGMQMQIAALRDTSWELVSSTMFGHRPNARITYFLIEVNERFQFKRFLEQLEAPAE